MLRKVDENRGRCCSCRRKKNRRLTKGVKQPTRQRLELSAHSDFQCTVRSLNSHREKYGWVFVLLFFLNKLSSSSYDDDSFATSFIYNL